MVADYTQINADNSMIIRGNLCDIGVYPRLLEKAF